MKLENCETEKDFFGWFLNKCRTAGWNPRTDAPLKDDHHWYRFIFDCFKINRIKN